MALKIRVKVKIPPELALLPEHMARAIENGLTMGAEQIKVDYGRTTQTWTARPAFATEKRIGERWVGTDNLIYKFVDEGTKPHNIFPRNVGGRLHFFTGGTPKSTPDSLYSEKGSPGTNEVFSQGVHHPGVKDRKFTIIIKRKWDTEAPRTLQRAIDAEIRRVGL